jgi:hypothetical protein
MRQAWLALVVLVCAVVGSGCLLPSNRPTVPEIVRALTPPQQLEGFVVDSVIIEQVRGDQFIDHDLWASVLPVGLPETRALFAENGLRAGILTGTPPKRFQCLFDSDADTVSPQRMTFNLRKDAVIPTAGPFDTSNFTVLLELGGKPKTVELKQAKGGVLVRPQTAPDGRVKLWCEPQVQHGTKQEWFRPNEDVTEFAKHEEVPVKKYVALGFDAILGSDDYLVIGWSAEQTATLGEVLFSAEVDKRLRQRLLVIRARLVLPQGATDLPQIGGPLKRPAVASIAASPK